MLSERRLKSGITKAVRHFWETRSGQAKKQQDAGRSDQGWQTDGRFCSSCT